MADLTKATASIIVPGNDSKYWYVRSAKDNKWGLAGGKIHMEAAEVAAQREAKEELGIRVYIESLVGIYQFKSEEGNPILNIVYAARIIEGTPHITRPDEILEIQEFSYETIIHLHAQRQIRAGKANIAPLEDYRAGHLKPLDTICCLL